MRSALFALCSALLIVGCTQQSATKSLAGTDNTPRNSMLHDPDKVLPQWMPIARVSGSGDVRFDRQSITRSPDDITAEILIEIRYPDEQQTTIEDADFKEVIAFQRERVLYRFDCEAGTAALIERRLMGQGDSVSHTIPYPSDSSAFKPVKAGGIAMEIIGPACNIGKG
jgi:hypothetical protein